MTDSRRDTASLAGVLVAAGAGRRYGRPKALLRRPTGEAFVAHAATTLYAGGLPRVVVVLGAGADEAAALVPAEPWCTTVVASDWAEGMGASLRAGLDAVSQDDGPAVDAVVVTLVDLPDVTAEVVTRLLAQALPDTAEPADARAALGRAAYGGVPGHPVIIGRDHWPAVYAAARGDAGARAVFAAYPHLVVECGDLATGLDLDVPPAEASGPTRATDQA